MIIVGNAKPIDRRYPNVNDRLKYVDEKRIIIKY